VPNVKTARLDVLDKAAIGEFVRGLKTLDVLFNCAGVVHNGTALQASDDDLELAFRLNVRAQLWLIQAVLPLMQAAGKGSIINMASVCSSLKGLPSRCIYGTTKAAVIGLTKSVAADYVGDGIRCNAVCPGTVDTPSLADRINVNADPAAARQAFVARQPMGRLAQASEIAPLVLFLASDESQFVTGQAYAIDGGITI
jgi:2-keto-3-deoxy-L-fuconate dehydrogenase